MGSEQTRFSDMLKDLTVDKIIVIYKVVWGLRHSCDVPLPEWLGDNFMKALGDMAPKVLAKLPKPSSAFDPMLREIEAVLGASPAQLRDFQKQAEAETKAEKLGMCIID